MTANDIKTGQELMNEDFIKSNPAWVKVRLTSASYLHAVYIEPQHSDTRL
jgi:hypothetical protein